MKFISNKFGKNMRDDWVVKEEIRRCAFSIGEVYLVRLNYVAWQYFLQATTKPSLRQAFFKYCKKHRAELFVSERDPRTFIS